MACATSFARSQRLDLYEGLQQLPAVKAWIESEKGQQLRHSRDQIEAALGVKLTEICDELLGDSVVLALRLSPDAPADSSQARGLLLFQARDNALLERLIQVINAKQKDSGELAQVTDREHGGTTYHMREFPPAADRPSEWYVTYRGRNFRILQLRELDQVGDRPQRAERFATTGADVSGTRDASGSGTRSWSHRTRPIPVGQAAGCRTSPWLVFSSNPARSNG